MKEYKIGDYVCTLVRGFAIDGYITGKHGSADYYAIETLDKEIIYRYGEDIKPSIKDADFVNAVMSIRRENNDFI